MPSPSSSRGAEGELEAVRFLEREGYRILERNCRCPRGEIDIVAVEKGVLCFVEVRSRRSATHGDPLETVGGAKQARIARAARHYLATRRPADGEIRFDVVGLVWEPDLVVTLVRGAFEPRTTW